MTTNAALHVVFGAGQIGAGLARTLRARGLRVRVVRRSAKAVGDGLEVVAGDARDAEFARTATDGAAVVYHCMNPSAYSARAWEREFPLLGEALIASALAHGARLVCLDNLYGYGPTDAPRTESTPPRATGRKGLVRVRWQERLETARADGLRYVSLRPGDFFGPGTEQALVSGDVVRALASGKRPLTIGRSDVPHAFSYVPDVVAALAALGTASDDVEGQSFHAPVLEVTTAELFGLLGEALGVRARPRVVGPHGVALLAPFVPALRELRETLYQWDRPFLVSDARFRARFPGLGTSLADAVRDTAAAAHPAPRLGSTAPVPA